MDKQPYKILLVDDDPMVMLQLSKLVGKISGKHVLVKARDGMEALRKALDEQPNLIIMDWEMPVLSGMDALLALKKDPKTREIPVIMATGNSSSEALKDALEAGAIDYVRKPIDTVELTSRVSSAIRFSLSRAMILAQKDQLERNHQELQRNFEDLKLLGYIGQQLTSSLSVEKIMDTSFRNLQNIIPFSVFGIGLHNPANDSLEFFVTQHSGERLPYFSYTLAETNRMAVQCFLRGETFLIGDFDVEYVNYVECRPDPKVGQQSRSMIYLPLSIDMKKVGVITIQSSEVNVYNKYHTNLLANLTAFIAIALDKARIYAQLESQKKELEKKNRSITSSINYASRIQSAILPAEEEVRQFFPDSFVFFQPRDIVSGDFYWMRQTEKSPLGGSRGATFLAAADCTGHGVPGAFMSMLGKALLDEVVSYRQWESASQILTELRELLKRSLKQSGKKTDNKDGMDVAMCIIDNETLRMHFSGAFSPLYIVRAKGQPMLRGELSRFEGPDHWLYQIRANTMPIGIFYNEGSFTNHELQLLEGDALYMFSDGYQDQFGGPEGKKFMTRPFKQMVVEAQKFHMAQQREIVERTFLEWKGQEEQLDDVMVLGVRIHRGA